VGLTTNDLEGHDLRCGQFGYEPTETVAPVKFLPLVWAALWRNRSESLLTLLALSVAFALFGTMLALNAAYDRVIDDARTDRLIVACAFDCGAIPLGYREQIVRIAGVTGVGGQLWLGGHEQDMRHPIPSGIFLTRTATARRNVRIGGTVTLNTAPGSRVDGGGTWFFTVLGFIPDPPGWGAGAGGPGWDPETIVGNLRYFENSSDLDERSIVNVLRVAVDRPERARSVCRAIEARFTSPAVYCVPAREDAEEIASANVNLRQISLGIGAAGLFMILFLCANGIAESVRERLPEFGVLKTMGYADGRIAALVVLEAATPTVLAALIGSVLAQGVGAFVAHLATKGVIHMPEMRASTAAFVWALAAELVIALVSVLAPLNRLRRMDVATVVTGR
jgi:putative ABC transport system permease protein